ncbi:MAG: hypothetical protein ABSA43_01660 [Candidatus Microgenomates bacterium]|jgi:hypothetical protein
MKYVFRINNYYHWPGASNAEYGSGGLRDLVDYLAKYYHFIWPEFTHEKERKKRKMGKIGGKDGKGR